MMIVISSKVRRNTEPLDLLLIFGNDIHGHEDIQRVIYTASDILLIKRSLLHNEIRSMKHAYTYTMKNILHYPCLREYPGPIRQQPIFIIRCLCELLAFPIMIIHKRACVSSVFSFSFYLVISGNAFFRHFVTHLLAKVPQSFVCSR